MGYGVFLFEDSEEVTKFDFRTLKDAKEELMSQLNILAKHEKANEFQPTMNFKDRFHYYLRYENGREVKRDFIISKVYKAKRMSLRTLSEAKEVLLNDFRMI